LGPWDAEGVPGFAAVVTRTLAKACAERYQTTTELLTDLSALRGRAWSTSASAAVKTSAQPVERALGMVVHASLAARWLREEHGR
jgi:hypothetical protein